MTRVKADMILSTPERVVLVALVLILLVLSAWGVYATLTSAHPILIWDLHPPWTALHAMLWDGVDPYGPKVLAIIQRQMLGRAALPGEDQLMFSVFALGILWAKAAHDPVSVAQQSWRG